MEKRSSIYGAYAEKGTYGSGKTTENCRESIVEISLHVWDGLGGEVVGMYTISDIVSDIERGCAVNNLNEDKFTYRIVCFINAEDRSEKHYTDTQYKDLRPALENIIRGNLTTTNAVVIAAVTTLKEGKCVSLLSKAYGFNLNEYFRQIYGKSRKKKASYGRYALNAN